MRPAIKHPIPRELKQALRILTPQQQEVLELVCGLRPDGKRHSLREIATLPSQNAHSWQGVARKRDRVFQLLWPLGFQAFQVLDPLQYRNPDWEYPDSFYQKGYDLVERVW